MKSLLKCQQGNIAVITALVMTGLMVGTGIAVDYGNMVSKRGTLQAVADAASIAAARELALANTDTAELEAVANNMVSLKTELAGSSLSVSVTVDQSNASIEVAVTENWTPNFTHLLSDEATSITVSATAQIVSSGKICLLGLSQVGPDTVHLTTDAKLTAHNCGVYSNSSDPSGIAIDLGAQLEAETVCSAGGASSAASNAIHPAPTTDCPVMDDPLKDRPAPSVGPCDHNKTVIKNQNVTLSPGVYCKGISIKGISDVRFLPGTYIIKGSRFSATDTSTIEGENVGFFMTEGGTISWAKDTTVRFTAPREGLLAGLLIFEDPALKGKQHRITSNNARVLTGTIYLPSGNLTIDAKRPIADKSAYTAIIANSLKLKDGPELHLNANYGATDIPVPSGLSGIGGRIVLAE